MIEFEEWLYNLEYPFEVPGIPSGNLEFPQDPAMFLAYDEKPERLTFYDLCRKKNITSLA